MFVTFPEWALASFIAGDRRSEAGLATPEEVVVDPATGSNPRSLQPRAIRQSRQPIREGEYGLVSAVDTGGPAFISPQFLELAKAIAASPPTGAMMHLEALLERPATRTLRAAHDSRDIVNGPSSGPEPRKQRAGNAAGGS